MSTTYPLLDSEKITYGGIFSLKELYEHLETAIDKCEDAANIVEAVVLKNA